MVGERTVLRQVTVCVCHTSCVTLQARSLSRAVLGIVRCSISASDFPSRERNFEMRTAEAVVSLKDMGGSSKKKHIRLTPLFSPFLLRPTGSADIFELRVLSLSCKLIACGHDFILCSERPCGLGCSVNYLALWAIWGLHKWKQCPQNLIQLEKR